MYKVIKTADLLGRKIGKLKIMSIARDKKGKAVAICNCECGGKWKGLLSNLTRDVTVMKSCGCLGGEQTGKVKSEFSESISE